MPQGQEQSSASTPVEGGTFVALGANLPSIHGDPAKTVAAAIDALAALGSVTARSRLWSSPAWPPGEGLPNYVNAVVRLDTVLAPDVALAALHAIEARFGRVRGARWGARILDLDLLSMDGLEGDGARPLLLPDAATQEAWRSLPPDRQATDLPRLLILPHPRLQDRGFVLAPLAEIAPGWRHPALGLTVREMLSALPSAATEGLVPIAGR